MFEMIQPQKNVGVLLSMMWDQDIQLNSDSFICTSHKRASQHYFYLWLKKNKGYFIVLGFHQDTSKVCFYFTSKKGFFWISATKGISLCEGWGWGKLWSVYMIVCKKKCVEVCVCVCL